MESFCLDVLNSDIYFHSLLQIVFLAFIFKYIFILFIHSCEVKSVSHSAESDPLWPSGLRVPRLRCPWSSPDGTLVWAATSPSEPRGRPSRLDICLCISPLYPCVLHVTLHSIWDLFWFVLECLLQRVNQSFQRQHHLLNKVFSLSLFSPPPPFLVRGSLRFIIYFAFLKRIDWCFIDLPSFWKGENCGGKMFFVVHIRGQPFTFPFLSVMLPC